MKTYRPGTAGQAGRQRALGVAILGAVAAVWAAVGAAQDKAAKDDDRPGMFGSVLVEAAQTVPDPDHLSKLRTTLELGAKGKLADGVRFRLSGRARYDFAYDIEDDHYARAVRRDQRSEFQVREAFVDFGRGDWEFRLGRQHIVWGEMVSVFIADVVSARDLREFLLPELERIRIPQWAARAEFFSGDTHAEMVWVPVPTIDKSGKPGADFYAYPWPTPGFATRIADERRPSRNSSQMNFGARFSTLAGGWDLSGFFYRSTDSQPTYYRQLQTAPTPIALFEGRHDRISQTGATVSKDLGGVVLRAEAVHTDGRRFNVSRVAADDGLVPLRTIDWGVGIDITPMDDVRVNLQLYQRYFLEHDRDIAFDRSESGGSVLVNWRVRPDWEIEALVATGFNRRDTMVRPALIWQASRNVRVKLGYDSFSGDPIGVFGRFDRSDRVYAELKWSF